MMNIPYHRPLEGKHDHMGIITLKLHNQLIRIQTLK